MSGIRNHTWHGTRKLWRRKGSLGALFAACGFSIGAARAADLTPVPIAVAAIDWSGGYVGLQGSAGASFGTFNFGPTTVGNRSIPAFKTGDTTGRDDLGRNATTAVGGLLAGWNWQSGPYVYGIEADLVGANLKRPIRADVRGLEDEGTDPAFPWIRAKTDWFCTARVRLGYAFDRNLVYASAGLAGANARVFADYPAPTGGLAASARRDLSFLGFALGAGFEHAITPHLSLGLDFRYLDLGESDRYLLGTVPVPGGGRVSTRSDFVANEMMARLAWHPEGLALPGGEAPAELDPRRYSLHGQATFVNQGVTGFHAPYSGEQSLVPHQAQATTTATAYLGFKLLEGTELYYNPEFSQGFGLSRTLGVAGFVNGEAQKAGAPFPKLRSERYFLRQTFGLGGGTEEVVDGPNSIAGQRDIERITIVAGKFAMSDYFDNNAYARDPRVDFMNWGLWASGGYDFPANLPGYTQGVMVEYNRAEFAMRGAYTQVPKEPASNVLDPRIFERAGATIELEERYVLPVFDRPGKLRLGLVSHVGNVADYRNALALTQAGLFADVNDAVEATRAPRRKNGFYVNLEQSITDDLGVFARVSANDGKTESLSFTDIDNSVSGGVALAGNAWGRPDDTIGLGAVQNGLSPAHRDFFAQGGLGLVIGDGRLSYAPERAIEAYYSMCLTDAVRLSLDYQHVANPAYNRDRGPADFFGTRLHAEF